MTDQESAARMLARQPWLEHVPTDGTWLRFQLDESQTLAEGEAEQFYLREGYTLTAQSIRYHLRRYAKEIGLSYESVIQRDYRTGPPKGLLVRLYQP